MFRILRLLVYKKVGLKTLWKLWNSTYQIYGIKVIREFLRHSFILCRLCTLKTKINVRKIFQNNGSQIWMTCHTFLFLKNEMEFNKRPSRPFF